MRRATESDLDTLAFLFDQYRQFYGRESDVACARRFLAERIKRHESTIFLATLDDGEDVGFTQLYPSFSSVSARRSFILNDLFVAPHARRRGVAASLLNAAAEHARSIDAVSIELSTGRANYGAQRLYESLGYIEDRKFVTYRLPIADVEAVPVAAFSNSLR